MIQLCYKTLLSKFLFCSSFFTMLSEGGMPLYSAHRYVTRRPRPTGARLIAVGPGPLAPCPPWFVTQNGGDPKRIRNAKHQKPIRRMAISSMAPYTCTLLVVVGGGGGSGLLAHRRTIKKTLDVCTFSPLVRDAKRSGP